EVSRYWFARAGQYIRRHPADWAALMIRKGLLVFNAYEVPDGEDYYYYKTQSSVLGLVGWWSHFGVLCPLAVAGVVLGWPRRRELWVLYLLALGTAASVALFYVSARYRFPMVPVMMMFAGLAVVEGVTCYREAPAAVRTRRLAPAAAAALAMAVLCNWPLIKDPHREHVAFTNLGSQLALDGKHAEATAMYRQALEWKPGDPITHCALGVSLMELGQLDEAVYHLREAVRLKPRYAIAHDNLGKALGLQRDYDQAILHFRRALEIDPEFERARRHLDAVLRVLKQAPQ
ncbi:MAG: tetratricopeptide repeat protein, partial [Alphaproteobacteria bacterium]